MLKNIEAKKLAKAVPVSTAPYSVTVSGPSTTTSGEGTISEVEFGEVWFGEDGSKEYIIIRKM